MRRQFIPSLFTHRGLNSDRSTVKLVNWGRGLLAIRMINFRIRTSGSGGNHFHSQIWICNLPLQASFTPTKNRQSSFSLHLSGNAYVPGCEEGKSCNSEWSSPLPQWLRRLEKGNLSPPKDLPRTSWSCRTRAGRSPHLPTCRNHILTPAGCSQHFSPGAR